MCGATLLKGGLYIGKHEGDTLHLLQIVLRIADGEWPHLDFMTPIGLFAFAPIALFVSLGFGAGTAIGLAQLLVALLLLPAVWWASYSRLRGAVAYFFGLVVLVLVAALVHGEAQRSVSISMHYNRWAWAISFVAIVLAVVPTRLKPRQGVDGLIIGLALASLLLIKITYFASFALPIALAMLMRGNYRAFLTAVASGLVVLLVISLMAGFDYWRAYLVDLLTVLQSDVRPAPGEPFGAVITAPAYLGGSMTLVLGVILMRNAGERVGGAILLLLMPGFFFVTYQNFANDPQWLLLLGVLLLAAVPTLDIRNALGWDMRTALRVAAAVALALETPQFLNLAFSPIRNLNVDTADYSPMLPDDPRHADLQSANIRTWRVDVRRAYDTPGSMLEPFAEEAERDPPVVLNGETFPYCTVEIGLTAWFKTIADDLDAAGFSDGKRVFAADLFSSYWLFGSLQPLVHGAPWYYAGLPGLRSADYVLVPLCPVAPDISQQILATMEEAGITLSAVRRTELYVLLRPTLPEPSEGAQGAADEVEG